MPVLPNEIFQEVVQYAGLVKEIKRRRQKYLLLATAFTWDKRLMAVFTQDFKKYLCEFELIYRAFNEGHRFPGFDIEDLELSIIAESSDDADIEMGRYDFVDE